MTSKINHITIQNAFSYFNTPFLSEGALFRYLISDGFTTNLNYLESKGVNLDMLQDMVDDHVDREIEEMSGITNVLSELSKQTGQSLQKQVTPMLNQILTFAKDEVYDRGEFDVFFEDFIDASVNHFAKDSAVTALLLACGYNSSTSNNQSSTDTTKDDKSKYEELEKLCINLNEQAKNGHIDPLIGREKEVQEMIEVLLQYKKKCPLLVGPPGTGKTQIVEGLASAIESGNVPDALKGSVIYSLDTSTLVSGTKFRGDFEQRMQNLIKELKQAKDNDENFILFIDEVHTAMGAGANQQGGADVVNTLKPHLASGAISLIGSTTDDEFQEHIEKDKAFTRRLQKVIIEEPSADDTLKILEQGIKPVLEAYHGVTYSKKVLQRAVELSDKYITQQYFPDKAIALIDKVGAKLKANDSSNRKTVSVKDIEEVISFITKTPMSAFKKANTKAGYVDLEKLIKKELFGQDDAIKSVVEAYELSKAGLQDPGQAIGSFLMLGPTGTGKTELAKLIAKHTESKMLKLDMNEYGEKHSVSKLFGAPPGYKQSEQGGVLTNHVMKYPHSVLLLDEIEKSHKKVLESLLGIIDGATMTDGKGNKVDFSNTIILMTSNAGISDSEQVRTKKITFNKAESSKQVEKEKATVKMDVINEIFAAEFRNKLSGMIEFNSLGKDVIGKITDKFIDRAATKLYNNRNVTISVSQEVKDFLSEEGYDVKFGARPIARVVKEHIEKALVKPLLKGEIVAKDKIEFKMVDGKPQFSIVQKQETKEEEATATK